MSGRDKNLLLLWIGQVLSQAGTRLYQIATLWWLLSLEGASGGTRMGLFLMTAALPALVFVKPIGRAVDRFRTKPLLMLCDASAVLVTLTLFASLSNGRFTLPAVFAAGFALAFFQAVIDPALNKAVPELVEPEGVERGVALIASTQSIANFGGAVAGAVIVAKFGITGAVLANALSYALSFAALACVSFRYRPQRGSSTREAGNANSGVLAGRPLLKRVLVGFGLVNFFSSPTFLVLPVYVKNELRLDANGLALLEACLWSGLVAGTFSGRFFPVKNTVIRFGGTCLFIFGLALFLPGLWVASWAYAAFLTTAGFALGLNNVKFLTLFQDVVEDSGKGAFFATLGALVSFTFPVAYFSFGILADHIPVTSICLIQGSGVLFLAAWYWHLSPHEGELYAVHDSTVKS
jgi:MFS family permease